MPLDEITKADCVNATPVVLISTPETAALAANEAEPNSDCENNGVPDQNVPLEEEA